MDLELVIDTLRLDGLPDIDPLIIDRDYCGEITLRGTKEQFLKLAKLLTDFTSR